MEVKITDSNFVAEVKEPVFYSNKDKYPLQALILKRVGDLLFETRCC